jgi:hypothetical protein
MSEIGIYGCFILDVSKQTNGRDIDLDQAELTLFVGRVSNESNGIAGKVEMDLRGIKVLGAYRPRVDGPNGRSGISFDAPPNQTIQEIVKLENLVGCYRDIGPLGKRSCVGGVSCDAHARCIQKVNNE